MRVGAAIGRPRGNTCRDNGSSGEIETLRAANGRPYKNNVSFSANRHILTPGEEI